MGRNLTSNSVKKPKVFVDADVLIAGAVSPSVHSSSLAILKLSELSLIHGLTSQQVIVEAERTLSANLPKALSDFRLLVGKSLKIVPEPNSVDFAEYLDNNNSIDLPILITALRENCDWLVTFNIRYLQPKSSSIKIRQPREFANKIGLILCEL